MKCIVCDSPDELEEYSIQSGGNGDPICDGPDMQFCEWCHAEYVEGDLVTMYEYTKDMPESVRAYLDKPKKCQECGADEFAEFLEGGKCDNCQDEK